MYSVRTIHSADIDRQYIAVHMYAEKHGMEVVDVRAVFVDTKRITQALLKDMAGKLFYYKNGSIRPYVITDPA